MPEVARRALVSEATAYRYFPDLISLLREALEGPGRTRRGARPGRASRPTRSTRVAFACEYLLRGVHAYQGAVRAMISHTITAPAAGADPSRHPVRPHRLRARPLRAPAEPAGGPALDPEAMTSLKQELAVVVSAEAFFVLTDLCGLAPDDAIRTAARTAATLTSAAFAA